LKRSRPPCDGGPGFKKRPRARVGWKAIGGAPSGRVDFPGPEIRELSRAQRTAKPAGQARNRGCSSLAARPARPSPPPAAGPRCTGASSSGKATPKPLSPEERRFYDAAPRGARRAAGALAEAWRPYRDRKRGPPTAYEGETPRSPTYPTGASCPAGCGLRLVDVFRAKPGRTAPHSPGAPPRETCPEGAFEGPNGRIPAVTLVRPAWSPAVPRLFATRI